MQAEQQTAPKSLTERVNAHAETCARKGIFPYEGQWLTIADIKKQIHLKSVRERIQAAELLLLFALVYLIGIGAWLLISLFCY